MRGSDKPEGQTLLTLAGILDIPVERFFDDDGGSTDEAGAQECLRLWSALRTREGRERALRFIHSLVEAERR